MFSRDAAQQALGFLVSQTSNIEAQVYRTQYPEIQYPNLVPVDTAGNEWAKSTTFFSLDQVGQANWFHHLAHDMPLADVDRQKFERGLEMAGIGYRYTLEEIGQAMLIPGFNLTTERGDAARRAYEEFLDTIVLLGDAAKGWTGLLNDANVAVTSPLADGTGGSTAWADKTPQQILRDINEVLIGVYTGSQTVETANTLLLPVTAYSLLATTQLTNTALTVMEFLQRYNSYTAQSGQPLTIRAVRGLGDAADGGGGRAVAYRRDPAVLKLHLPMPHRFLPVWQTGPLIFDVPGIFRTGGLEIRRPGAVRYLDDIQDAPYL